MKKVMVFTVVLSLVFLGIRAPTDDWERRFRQEVLVAQSASIPRRKVGGLIRAFSLNRSRPHALRLGLRASVCELLLRPSSVRRHQPKIMFGVLVVVLCPDRVTDLGFSTGECQILLIGFLRVLGFRWLGTRGARRPPVG